MRFSDTVSRRAALGGFATFGMLGIEGLLATDAYANILEIGQPAPPATLITLDGQHLSTADMRGQVVILTFWATWCVPCREELPLLSTYAARHAPQGLRVLGFSLDTPDQLQQVRAVARSLSFPVGLMDAKSAPGYGRIWRIPVNFTIGRDGRLIDNGWKDKKPVWTQERLESIVTPQLSGPSQGTP
jgi:cytochrome c biogenesis protein CcmG/thiol:disulfide interchange protein DsbE